MSENVRNIMFLCMCMYVLAKRVNRVLPRTWIRYMLSFYTHFYTRDPFVRIIVSTLIYIS